MNFHFYSFMQNYTFLGSLLVLTFKHFSTLYINFYKFTKKKYYDCKITIADRVIFIIFVLLFFTK